MVIGKKRLKTIKIKKEEEETEYEQRCPSTIMFTGDGSLNLKRDFSYSKIHTLDAKRGSSGAR